MRIPIVFSTDHKFVAPTCVTILSLLMTKAEEVAYDINIIRNEDVTEEDIKILTEQVKVRDKNSTINFVNIGDIFSKGYQIRDISTACYSRLMIPWLFPDYDKIIYSDVDIIYKKDISEIYDIDMKDFLVAGVTGEVWTKGSIRKYLEKKGMDPSKYINSGFLVINSKLQRKENIQEIYLQLAKDKYLYQDQDIINIACKGKVKLISHHYNMKPSEAFKNKETKGIHYIGMKPWQTFTYCWDDWWMMCKSSNVYNNHDYGKISSSILSLKSRLKVFNKRTKENIKFRLKLLSR